MEWIKKHLHALLFLVIPQIILLLLKLCDISWSWWIILLPLEIYAFISILLVIVGIVLGFVLAIRNKKDLIERAKKTINAYDEEHKL